MFTLGDVADILDSALDTGISIVDALAKLSDLADEGSLGTGKGFEEQSDSAYDENGNIITLNNFVNNVLLSDDSGVCSGNSIVFSNKSSTASTCVPDGSCGSTSQSYISTVAGEPRNYQSNLISGNDPWHSTSRPGDFDDALLETFQRCGTYVIPSTKDNVLDELPVFQAFGNLCHVADDVLNYNQGVKLQQSYENIIETNSDALNLKVNDMLQSFQQLDATVEKLKLQAMQRHLKSHPEDECILNTHHHSFDGILPVPQDILQSSDPGTPVTLRKDGNKRPNTYIVDSSSSSINKNVNKADVCSNKYSELYLQDVADHSYSRQASQETYILDDEIEYDDNDSNASSSSDEKTNFPKNDNICKHSRDTYILLHSKDNMKSVRKSLLGSNSTNTGKPQAHHTSEANTEVCESLHDQHSGRNVLNKDPSLFYQKQPNDELKQKSINENTHSIERNKNCRQTYVLYDPLRSPTNKMNGVEPLNSNDISIHNPTFFHKKSKVTKENENRQTYVLCKSGKNKNKLKTENLGNDFDDNLVKNSICDDVVNIREPFTRPDVRSTYILSKTGNSTHKHKTKEISKTVDNIDESNNLIKRNAEYVEEGAITVLPETSSDLETYTDYTEKKEFSNIIENKRSTNIILENINGMSSQKEGMIDKEYEKRSIYVLDSNHKKNNKRKHMKYEFLKNANKNNDEVIFYVGKKQFESNDTLDLLSASKHTESSSQLNNENKTHFNHQHSLPDKTEQNQNAKIGSTIVDHCETSMEEFELLYEIDNHVKNINNMKTERDQQMKVESFGEFELIYEIAVPRNIEINKRNTPIKNCLSECNSINNDDLIIPYEESSLEEFVFNNSCDFQSEEEKSQSDGESYDDNCACTNYAISRENTFVKDESSNDNSSGIIVKSHFSIQDHISKENLFIEDGPIIECSSRKEGEIEMKSVNDTSTEILNDTSSEILNDTSNEIISDAFSVMHNDTSTKIVNNTSSELHNVKCDATLNDRSNEILVDSTCVQVNESGEILNDTSSEILHDSSNEILYDVSISDITGLNSKQKKLYSRAASLDSLIDSSSCMSSSRQPYERSFSNPSSSQIKNEFHNSHKTLFKTLDTLQNLMSSSLTKLNTLNYFREKNSSSSFVLSSHENILNGTSRDEFNKKSTDTLYSDEFITKHNSFEINKCSSKHNSFEINKCSSKHFPQNLASLYEESSSIEPVTEKDALLVFIDENENEPKGVKSSTPNSSTTPFSFTGETYGLASENVSSFNAPHTFAGRVQGNSYEEGDYFPETYTIKSNTSSIEEISQLKAEWNEGLCQQPLHQNEDDIITNFNFENSNCCHCLVCFFLLRRILYLIKMWYQSLVNHLFVDLTHLSSVQGRKENQNIIIVMFRVMTHS